LRSMTDAIQASGLTATLQSQEQWCDSCHRSHHRIA